MELACYAKKHDFQYETGPESMAAYSLHHTRHSPLAPVLASGNRVRDSPLRCPIWEPRQVVAETDANTLQSHVLHPMLLSFLPATACIITEYAIPYTDVN